MSHNLAASTLLAGDARAIMPQQTKVDLILTDPPYGDTSLGWDKRVAGWLDLAHKTLQPWGSMWVFGSMRFFRDTATDFTAAGWKLAQDIVWEKHNGSSFHADRFKRVHEHAVHFYPVDVPWAQVFKSPVTTPDATARAVRRKKRPPHTGHIEASSYVSVDGGPRLMRSVVAVRSCHGYAEHPTQKPVGILNPLIRYSCPEGGTVADWFMGSGSTGVAAVLAGRKFIGCEVNPEYFAVASRRVSQAEASADVLWN